MRLKDTGLTVQDIKDKVNKYMIETYERFDFLAETAEGMYMYDENGTPYLDFYKMDISYLSSSFLNKYFGKFSTFTVYAFFREIQVNCSNIFAYVFP